MYKYVCFNFFSLIYEEYLWKGARHMNHGPIGCMQKQVNEPSAKKVQRREPLALLRGFIHSFKREVTLTLPDRKVLKIRYSTFGNYRKISTLVW